MHQQQSPSLSSSDTMIFFQSIRKFYQTLGVCSLQFNKTYSFNGRIVFFYFTAIVVWISEICFCLFEAKSVIDYGKSSYALTIQLTIFWEFSTTIWQISNISSLIEKYEMFIEKSKRMFDIEILKINFNSIFDLKKNRIVKWIGCVH